MGRRNVRGLLGGLAALAMLTAACGGGETTTDPDDGGDQPTGGSFSVSSGEPGTLGNTAQCYDSNCSQVVTLLYTGLLRIDAETSEQILDMATSIESEDGIVWDIKIQDGWQFHNGEPVNADAFIRAWNYNAYGPNATQTGFFFSPVEGYEDLQCPTNAAGECTGDPKAEELTGLEAVDDTTIRVTLSEPFSQWPLVMSYTPAFAPMAEECEQDIETCSESPIGNGPYQIEGEWEHNQQITLARYEDYQGDNVGNADEIVFKIYGNLLTAFRDWQAGNVDIVTPDPTQIPQARQVAGDRIVEVDSGSFNYMGIPFQEEEFQDVRIRQALSLAIDRQTIIDRVLNGRFTPAQDVIAPFVPGSRTDACEFCTYDPERAKQLYDEAGGIPGDQITIWFNNDGGHEAWVEALAKGWQDVLGLEYEFETMPFTPYLAKLDAGEATGPYRLGWIPDYPSPENYLDPIYGEGSSNYGSWSGPGHEEFLELIDQADAAPTVEEGIPLYQQAADVVLRELPVLPLWFGKTFIIYSENVENVKFSPLEQLLLTEVTVVNP